MQRFWDKVDKTATCWEWKGARRGKTGYGCIKVNGKVLDVHRFSWAIHFGEIPKDLYVCHKCDNRLCVNPNHLFLGSPRDNVIDSIKKGRFQRLREQFFAKGEKNGRHKLTDETIRKIRKEYLEEKTSYRKLAKRFGINYSYVGEIIRNEKRVLSSNG